MPKLPDFRRKRKAQGQSARTVGLARALSKLGFCSRTQAAALIVAGNVRLNGAVRRNPETPVHLGRDRILVNEQPLQPAKRSYWMLNKPRGVVTTASDEQGRATIYDSLGELPTWLAPVGRLDKASEGLLLLTNDSEWAARVTAPETHLPKTYHVQIAAIADDDLLEALRRGVRSDGQALSAVSVHLLRHGNSTSWLEIVLDHGKNRHIRRMLEALGVDVLRLVRVAIGSLRLETLKKGVSRELTPAEKSRLDSEMQRNFKNVTPR